MVDGPSRRGFLAGAAALAGGAWISGCGSSSHTAASHPEIAQPRPPRAERREDVRILEAALALERRTIAAYAACIPLLDGADARWAQAFVIEENQQAGALAKLITIAGDTAPGQNGEPAIGHPRNAAEGLALLAALEHEQVASYLRWIPQLSAGTMRAGAATILAADAQHLSALRGARGQPPLISPFVLATAAGAA